ncbi:VOC family protein [Christiangramia sp. OXR-203]|uniref:VOC family protein n=1 Tax=Christiangramia sp. OXR-203 TaxID=3100176 RepID=UPI002AC93188|nr:VOC family protein [Christiangramia sp. OXR-203]WPY98348.1 VOC family protein [Christiangramia sp. OXR-203]
MEIDHIFIFSNKKGIEADDLVEFGFTEGVSRVHPGQGTTNRKFYFENFFLEILWVISEKEIQSEVTAKTKLWERSQFQKNRHSRFGLCLVNSESTDELFQQSEVYQPDYFPKGMSIDIITNEICPKLPWTFRLPYRGKTKEHSEPTEHPNGIQSLTKAIFEYPMENDHLDFVQYFRAVDTLQFRNTKRTHLNLEFDNNGQGKSKEFDELNLTINY